MDDDVWASSSDEDTQSAASARAAEQRQRLLHAFRESGDGDGGAPDGKGKKRKQQEEEENGAAQEVKSATKRQKLVVMAEEEKEKKQQGGGGPAEVNFDMFSDSASVLTLQQESKRESGDGHGEVTAETTGYYKVKLGDVLNGRYECLSDQGQGVFSTVIRCRDRSSVDGQEYAVKVIRKNPVLEEAGLREIAFLKQLTAADPKSAKYTVKFVESFWHHDHLCIVLESMKQNLRQMVGQLGGKGISIEWVQMYARQMLVSLSHMKSLNIIHADIKPDNMLVSEDSRVLKLCDLGSALRSTDDNDVTPLLVSRWYRAPEIILGLPYSEQLDIFSLGSVLFELYTGQVLFHGESNNDMLFKIQEVHGPVPKKMLRHSAFREEHYDDAFQFRRIVSDPLTHQDVLRTVSFPESGNPDLLVSRMASTDNFKKMSSEKQALVLYFKDFVLQSTVVDPKQRLTCETALAHPFVTGRPKAAK
jgi:serine/threonine-protein kinase PRP4